MATDDTITAMAIDPITATAIDLIIVVGGISRTMNDETPEHPRRGFF
jgi:hypothetical protein